MVEAQRFIAHVSDPAIGLDGDTVCACNDAAVELLGLDDTAGWTLTDLFGEDDDLAEGYADALHHYPDVAGVIEGDKRHFDADHTTVETLRAGRQFREADPDFGVFADGDLKYFHLRRSDVSDLPGDSDAVIIFRDVTELKDHERDLDFLRQVVSRVLRHNLRNNLSVARGYAATVEDRADGPVADMGAEIREACEDLIETSEKARRIQQTVEARKTVEFDLVRVVTDAIDDVAADHDGEFSVDLPSVTVDVNPQFPRAMEDTIENGIVYSEAPTPRVEVVAEREGPWLILKVSDNGPGIPDAELDNLARRGESELVHGSGAGLWLTHTVVEESGGDISYLVDDSGTTVRMRLPLAKE